MTSTVLIVVQVINRTSFCLFSCSSYLQFSLLCPESFLSTSYSPPPRQWIRNNSRMLPRQQLTRVCVPLLLVHAMLLNDPSRQLLRHNRGAPSSLERRAGLSQEATSGRATAGWRIMGIYTERYRDENNARNNALVSDCQFHHYVH